MASKTRRLGDFIEELKHKNRNGNKHPIVGVNSQKEIISTKSKNVAYDLSDYKIVDDGNFVVNFLGAPQKPRLPVARYRGDRALVTSAYKVFECREGLDPDYLSIFLNGNEVFRRLKFSTDKGVREDINWASFEDVQIPVPDIETQRKYASVYNALTKNQRSYEKSIDDLQLITDTYMDNLLKTINRNELGPYIKQVDNRNRDLSATSLKGISIQKKFIESKANMDGVSLAGYKIVKPSQFAYVTVTSRNGGKISIALNQSKADYVVSSTYVSFEIMDHSKLLPEFLLLWFKRSEFDRYARFNSWGSARETFDWGEMQRVRLPIPDIEIQKSIVAIHHVLESRKRMNEKLKNVVTNISPVLIRGVTQELELARV